MPKPLRIGKRTVWDRVKLELAFAALDEVDEGNRLDRALRMVPGGR